MMNLVGPDGHSSNSLQCLPATLSGHVAAHSHDEAGKQISSHYPGECYASSPRASPSVRAAGDLPTSAAHPRMCPEPKRRNPVPEEGAAKHAKSATAAEGVHCSSTSSSYLIPPLRRCDGGSDGNDGVTGATGVIVGDRMKSSRGGDEMFVCGTASVAGSSNLGSICEDRFIVHAPSRLVAVVDGHGGAAAAEHVAKGLIPAVLRELSKEDKDEDGDGEGEGERRRRGPANHPADALSSAVRALEASFLTWASNCGDESGACLAVGLVLEEDDAVTMDGRLHHNRHNYHRHNHQKYGVDSADAEDGADDATAVGRARARARARATTAAVNLSSSSRSSRSSGSGGETSSSSTSGSTTSSNKSAAAKIVHVAWCGDARVILCENGLARHLTRDHNPDNPAERDRLRLAKVRVRNGRVHGVLRPSRALGNRSLKALHPGGVVAEPECCTVSVQQQQQQQEEEKEEKEKEEKEEEEKEEEEFASLSSPTPQPPPPPPPPSFLLLATDGVFEGTSVQSCCDTVIDALHAPGAHNSNIKALVQQAAADIVAQARLSTMDDCTCVVLLL